MIHAHTNTHERPSHVNVLWYQQPPTKQGLTPCAAKYPQPPPLACPVILYINVLLSEYAYFVVLHLVFSDSKSTHLL